MASQISGITRDNNGNVAGSCDVYLLKYNSGTHLFTQVARVVSDASLGTFLFSGIADNDPSYNIIAFKDGSPDIFDVSDRNIVPQVVAAGTAWNINDKSANVTVSGAGSLTMLTTTSGGGVRSTTSHSTGKFYAQFHLDQGGEGNTGFVGIIGIASASASLNAVNAMDNPSQSIGLRLMGGVEWGGTGDGSALASVAVGKSVGMAVDLDNHKSWFISDDAAWSGLWQSGFTAANSVDIGTHFTGWNDVPSPTIFLFAIGLANSNTLGITLDASGTSSLFTVPTGYGNAW